MTDFILFTKVRDGDVSAYETLFRRYYEPLCMYSAKITDNLDIAEDIIQEIFYKIWKDRANLRIVLSVKSYLFGAVRNNSLQYIEHLKVRRQHQDYVKTDNFQKSRSPQDILEYKELEQQIGFALEKLPKRRQEIFKMNRFEGKKYEEIAREMSLSVKTIEAEMSKALQVVRKSINNEKLINN